LDWVSGDGGGGAKESIRFHERVKTVPRIFRPPMVEKKKGERIRVPIRKRSVENCQETTLPITWEKEKGEKIPMGDRNVRGKDRGPKRST